VVGGGNLISIEILRPQSRGLNASGEPSRKRARSSKNQYADAAFSDTNVLPPIGLSGTRIKRAGRRRDIRQYRERVITSPCG
jgi:hypothetical protein